MDFSVFIFVRYVLGAACRTRVTKVLCKMFCSPLEAERSIAVPLEAEGDTLMPVRAASPEQLHAAVIIRSTFHIFGINCTFFSEIIVG